jgi:hypothetical protein
MVAATSVEVVHDWVDYAAAAGGLAGVVGAGAAIVALVFASRSADDAIRSAEAAVRSANASEKSLELADASLAILRREAEEAQKLRELRANLDVDLHVRAMGTSSDGPPGYIVLNLGITNKDGTRLADDVHVNLFVPLSFDIRSCTGDGVGVSDKGGVVEAAHAPELYSDFNIWTDKIDSVTVNVTILRYIRVDRPPPGRSLITARLFHGDLPGGQSNREWWIDVPAKGEVVAVERDDPALVIAPETPNE